MKGHLLTGSATNSDEGEATIISVCRLCLHPPWDQAVVHPRSTTSATSTVRASAILATELLQEDVQDAFNFGLSIVLKAVFVSRGKEGRSVLSP